MCWLITQQTTLAQYKSPGDGTAACGMKVSCDGELDTLPVLFPAVLTLCVPQQTCVLLVNLC